MNENYPKTKTRTDLLGAVKDGGYLRAGSSTRIADGICYQVASVEGDSIVTADGQKLKVEDYDSLSNYTKWHLSDETEYKTYRRRVILDKLDQFDFDVLSDTQLEAILKILKL